MSVVTEFTVRTAVIAHDHKQVLMTDGVGNRHAFEFDIYCNVKPMYTKFNFFFDMKRKRVLIVYKDRFDYMCGLMNFWIEHDSPVLAAHWITNTEALIKQIQISFAEQLATYTIDEIINSSES